MSTLVEAVLNKNLDHLAKKTTAYVVHQAGGFALVKEDYPSAGFEKAARALTQTESFRQLYDKNDLPDMTDMILRQAKKPKAAEDK